jgi:uncharacterized protein YqhQ
MKPEFLVGGQAVIEGVMMKGPTHYSVAVRKPNEKISLKVEECSSLTKKYKILNLPFLRGIVYLIEMLVLGLNTLTYSANESAEKEEEQLSGKEIFFTIAIALLFAVGIFIALPLFITKAIIQSNGILFNFIDGIIRVLFFVVYVLLISMMKDVVRLFQYHGAEHKAVNCYEKGLKLTVANAKKQTTRHARCGTSFIVIVLILSIFVFSLIVSPNWIVKFLGRLIFVPIIAGISYELLKVFAKNENNCIIKLLIQPGYWVQGLTTREPDEKQLEIGLKAIKAVLAKETPQSPQKS